LVNHSTTTIFVTIYYEKNAEKECASCNLILMVTYKMIPQANNST